MDQGFNDKFERMLGNDVTRNENNIEFHDEKSYSRYLSFVLKDGKCRSFNYAYIVTTEYNPDALQITIEFTSHTVVLKGEKLEGLYTDLLTHLPKLIQCSNDRYNVLSDSKPVVNDITVMSNR